MVSPAHWLAVTTISQLTNNGPIDSWTDAHPAGEAVSQPLVALGFS